MSDDRPIIIKKIKKGGHGGHHGGAWKIAYADFVTAMMAFFLLMWLLNATTEKQKRGIANYFDPVTIGEHTGGGDGVMMGESVTSKENSAQSNAPRPSIKESKPQPKGEGGETAKNTLHKDEKDEDATQGPGGEMDGKKDQVTENPLGQSSLDTHLFESKKEQEKKNFDAIKKELEKSLNNNPELKEWIKNLVIDETPEGLRIQIVDQHDQSMFPSGSSEMYNQGKKLLKEVARIIVTLPNKISISGHTDATPYNAKNYSNWELSSDRANASRRVLQDVGVNADRFASVMGKEAREPFVKDDPFSPKNRRISITLLYTKGQGPLMPP